jgi:hypothetical protein
VDGIYSQNHNTDTMPRAWSAAPFNNDWSSSIFASQDPVAIESVLLDLYQLDDDPAHYPKMAGVEDYLTEAALANNPPSGTFYDPDHAAATSRLPSLGVFEHWNNGVDRKYSRNLGSGNGIELVMIERTATGVLQKPPSGARAGAMLRRSTIDPGAIEISVSEPGTMRLAMFDLQGKKLGTIFDRYCPAGVFLVGMQGSPSDIKRLPRVTCVLALYRTRQGISEKEAAMTITMPGR